MLKGNIPYLSNSESWVEITSNFQNLSSTIAFNPLLKIDEDSLIRTINSAIGFRV